MAKHPPDYYMATNKKGQTRIVMSYDVFKSLGCKAVCKTLNISTRGL